jgi:hypothetical protein
VFYKQFLCRVWIAAGKELTPAAATAAVQLSQGPAASSLLLESLRRAPDAATFNALLSHCTSASSTPLATDLLKLMAASNMELLPGACSALLKLPALQLRAITWYLSGSESSANSRSQSLKDAVQKLPLDCICTAAEVYASAGDAASMLDVLCACPVSHLKGSLQPASSALTAAGAAVDNSICESFLQLGVAAGDASFVAWQALHMLPATTDWSPPPELLQGAVVMLLQDGQPPAAIASWLKHYCNNAGLSAGGSSNGSSSRAPGLQWRPVAVAAIQHLQKGGFGSAAGSLEVVQLCLQEGAGLMELQGRAAGAAAKAGLWEPALQLLEVVRRGPAQAREQLLLGMTGLEGAAAEAPAAHAFLVSRSRPGCFTFTKQVAWVAEMLRFSC